MTEAATITSLLTAGVADAPAIGAPGREPLSHGDLRAFADRVVETLNGYGLGRDDRIAIVLPNGPEMAAAFVTVAAVSLESRRWR